MYRSTVGLLVFLTLGAPLVMADEPRLRDALVLQEAFQEAIKKAEPSIACILVSRSDVYQRWFGQTIPEDQPGRLGAFHPAFAILRVPPGDEERVKELRKNRPEIELKKLFDLGDPANVPEAFGSGVVINSKGLVLTNYHVVREATKLYVRLPGAKGCYADIHAADPRSDLAVLRLLDDGLLPVPAIKRGDASGIRKGQLVLSLANPFAAGFQDGSPSASWGIISNIRRRAPGAAQWEQDRAKMTLHHYGTLLQLDARLNLGCSGGAVIDLKGELIGLTTALAALTGSETAGGFAVPMDAAMRRIIDVLERGEEVEYGFLGVGFDRDVRRGEEVRVSSVISGSPAQRLGAPLDEVLIPQDAILSVNGTPIRENDDLFLAIGTLLAGAEARLEVRSQGRKKMVTVTLDKFYVPGKFIASRKPAAVRGLRVDYTSVLYQRDRPFPGILKGVFVREVLPGSPADMARLQDAIIARVNDREVSTPAEFYRTCEKLSGPLEFTIVNRSESSGFRKVKLD